MAEFDGAPHDLLPVVNDAEPVAVQTVRHPFMKRGIVAAVGGVGASLLLAGCVPGSGNGSEGPFNSTTTYYEYSGQQEGLGFTFYGCGPGGGTISNLGDIEQTTAQQLKEASIAQGGKCDLTIPAGQENPVQGAIYSYNNDSHKMTDLFACDDHSKRVTPVVTTQPSNQPFVEQSQGMTYDQLQTFTINVQNAKGNTDSIESLYASIGIKTPFYSPQLKQNVVRDLAVVYPVSKSDAADPEGQGNNWTLASNLIDATDTPFELGNADTVPEEVPLGTGDSPFIVTAFYSSPDGTTPTPAATPAECATSHVESMGAAAPDRDRFEGYPNFLPLIN